MNQLVSIGIKVLAAVGVGAAVYFGLDKVAKPKKQEPSQPRNNNCGCNNENCNCSQVNNNPNSNYSNQQPNEGQAEMRTEDKIVHGLKTAQEVCGRAFSLCQNLAVAAENIIKIFGGGNNYNNNNYYSGGYNYNSCQGPNNGYHDKYGDPPGFRRISPYILEFVGDGRNNNGGNYCDCNGNYNNNQGGLW